MFKKSLLSTALLAAFAAGSAHGATIGLSIDPNGSAAGGSGPLTGASAVYNLGWSVGNAIAVPDAGNVPTSLQAACGGYSGPNTVVFSGSGTPCGTFTTYAQASLATFGDIDNNPVAFSGTGSGNGEWTFVTKLKEVLFPSGVTGASLIVTSVEYFEIWYDPTPDKNDLTGTGFSSASTTTGVVTSNDDAVRILYTNTLISEGQNNGVFNRDIDTSTGLPKPNVPLDSFSSNNYSGVDSIQGNGSTTLRASVKSTDYDHNFFLENGDFEFAIDFSTANKTPFVQTNPASCFYDSTTGTWLGGAGNPTGSLGAGAPAGFVGCGNTVGSTNGISGPNVMFQTQAASSFLASVPEPATIALLGFGLVGAAVSRRTAKQK